MPEEEIAKEDEIDAQIDAQLEKFEDMIGSFQNLIGNLSKTVGALSSRIGSIEKKLEKMDDSQVEELLEED